MSIIRLAVAISCAVAVLPSDKLQQAKLYEGAVGAAQWAGTYCEREPIKCQQAAAFWEQFKSKAQFAAAIGYDALQHYSAVADHAASSAEPSQPLRAAMPEIPLTFGRGTLTGSDLAPAWRGTSKARKS